MKLVPDSNILISAVIWGGNPAQLMELGLRGEVELFLSPEIIEETMEVLKRKGLSEERLSEAQEYIAAAAIIIRPAVKLELVKDDPDDNKIAECAVAAGADAIITNDKHLLRLGNYQGVRMMRVAEFLQSLRT
jgi:uncharacterized protein